LRRRSTEKTKIIIVGGGKNGLPLIMNTQ